MDYPHRGALHPCGAGGVAPTPGPGPPAPPPPVTLTVFLLQDQDHVRLLQADLVRLPGQIGPGDLHLGQVCGAGGVSAGLSGGDVGSTSQHIPRGLVAAGSGLGTRAGDTWQLPSGGHGQADPAWRRGHVASTGQGRSQGDGSVGQPAPSAPVTSPQCRRGGPGTERGLRAQTDTHVPGQAALGAGGGAKAGRYLLAPCHPPARAGEGAARALTSLVGGALPLPVRERHGPAGPVTPGVGQSVGEAEANPASRGTSGFTRPKPSAGTGVTVLPGAPGAPPAPEL